MLLAAKERTISTAVVLDEADFGIDPSQVAHIMGILRDSLYTRKALALLREYGANAWDEHIQSGRATLPIHVTVPTHAAPYFVCRDYGRGLSRQQVLLFYTQYGASNKRGDTDCEACMELRAFCSTDPKTVFCKDHDKDKNTVGALGIGCKSAFCMSDQFIITSWFDGTKSVYSAALDKSNKGKMTLLHEEPCGDETGIEVKVAVQPRYIDEFQREAKAFYKFMDPQPKINVQLDPLPESMTNGWITTAGRNGDWTGVMGCIPYRIDLEQIRDELQEAGVHEALHHLQGGIFIPVGEVEFSANREELQYTEVTINAIVPRFKALVQEYVDDALKTLREGDENGWQKRRKAQFLTKGLGIPLPKRLAMWAADTVTLYNREEYTPKFHMLSSSFNPTNVFRVAEDTIFMVHDGVDARKMDGWQTLRHDVIIKPREGVSVTDAKADLATLLKVTNCEGAKVHDLASERSWFSSQTSNRREAYSNEKHRRNTFVLKKYASRGERALSSNWEIAEPPEEDHIYVIINSFQVVGRPDIYQTVNEDREMARVFDLKFPKRIYGYKTTVKRPVMPDDIDGGVDYFVWREEFFGALMTAERRNQFRDIAWAEAFDDLPYTYRRWSYIRGKDGPDERNFVAALPQIIATLTDELGPKHLVTRLFTKQTEAAQRAEKIPRQQRNYIRSLAKRFPGRNNRSAVQCHIDRMLDRYPMFRLAMKNDDDVGVFVDHLDTIISYIKSVDEAQP